MIAALAAAYAWTQVIVPGQTAAQQFGINDKGETAVTTAEGASGIYRHGRFTPLPPPPASCNCQVFGAAINDAGLIAGIAFLNGGAGPEQGFVLSGATYTFFSWPGWQNTEPRGIGDQGLVVGWAFNDDLSNAGFIYDPATGAFTDVTPPGSGYPTIVQGINRFGRIGGSGADQRPRRVYGLVSQAAPRSAFGGTQLPFLEKFEVSGEFTRARGINDFGLTAGAFNGPDGTFVGYVGSPTWGFEQLSPPGADAAGASTFCTGLNNLGQVPCSVTDPDGVTTRLYIGSPQEDVREATGGNATGR